MTRSIDIWYQNDAGNTDIEVPAPYYLFGCQSTSMEFWSIPRLKTIGIKRLTELGVSDPVYFSGWDDMPELLREICLLQQHLESIDFFPSVKAQWLSHLVYCYFLLVRTAPKDSTPIFMIG